MAISKPVCYMSFVTLPVPIHTVLFKQRVSSVFSKITVCKGGKIVKSFPFQEVRNLDIISVHPLISEGVV